MTVASHPLEGPRWQERRWATVRALVSAARPRQWTKNALLFAALLFAGRAGDAESWLRAGTACVAYCALSGAAYLGNDLLDREADRRHPVKRSRPVASGALSPRTALVCGAALGVGGVLLASTLGIPSVALAGGFVLLQVAYSTVLKRLALIDLLAIAGLFLLRASAGAAAVHVHVSDWLLACTALLALFLGLAKRRGELMLVASGATPGRASLSGYTVRSLERLLTATASVAVLSYVAYASTAHDSWEMLLTVPPVGFGIGRYLHLVRRHGAGEEPERVLLADRPILLTIVLWAALAAVILGT